MNSKPTRTRLMAFSTVSAGAFPGPQHRARPEGIAAGAAHRVPIGDAEAEVVLHRLALDHLVLVVVAERQRVLRLRAFVADFGDIGKCGHGETPWNRKWAVIWAKKNYRGLVPTLCVGTHASDDRDFTVPTQSVGTRDSLLCSPPACGLRIARLPVKQNIPPFLPSFGLAEARTSSATLLWPTLRSPAESQII